ncbi:MAG: purine-nucleoside phosphorylase [Bacteroidales bacterium]
MMDRIKATAEFLNKNGFTNPEFGVILGTGLGKLVNHISVRHVLEYDKIPDFPVSTVESHDGRLIYGTLGEKKVVAMQGRFHYYEGYSMQQIVFPVRVMKMLGIKYLLVSNAAGNVNLDFKKGELMLITDHINLLGDNPLIGPNIDELGTRFPDMSQPYSASLNEKIIAIAKRDGIKLNQGVYAAVAGPNLETRAEYRYMRSIGADLIGMSTIPEVIAANHMKLPVAAISVITDECDPDNLKPVNIREILEVAGKAEVSLTKILVELVKEL